MAVEELWIVFRSFFLEKKFNNFQNKTFEVFLRSGRGMAKNENQEFFPWIFSYLNLWERLISMADIALIRTPKSAPHKEIKIGRGFMVFKATLTLRSYLLTRISFIFIWFC